MIDYTYVECTSACVTALAAFQKRHPTHRTAEIKSTIAQAAKFMESKQEEDGSWCVRMVVQSRTVALSGGTPGVSFVEYLFSIALAD
jgi:squalene cyclase